MQALKKWFTSLKHYCNATIYSTLSLKTYKIMMIYSQICTLFQLCSQVSLSQILMRIMTSIVKYSNTRHSPIQVVNPELSGHWTNVPIWLS